MQIEEYYRYANGNGGTDVSMTRPSGERPFTTIYRLVADDGKMLTADGIDRYCAVEIYLLEDAEQWEEVATEGGKTAAQIVAEFGGFSEQTVPSDRVGFDFKITKLGEIELRREYVPNGSTAPEGDYLHPIPYVQGMAVEAGKWYTDGEDIWEALKAGTPAGFDDREYFDII